MRFLLRSGVPAVVGLLGLVLALPAAGRIEPGARDSSATRPAEAPATIYDSTLHVTWLADADLAATKKFGLPINHDGSMDYSTARAWVRRLNRHDYLGHSDWTLPITPTPYKDAGCSSENKKGGGNFGFGCSKTPLASLYARAFRLKWPDTAVAIPDETTGPFHDFQPYLYWTNTRAKSGGFRTFSFNTGWSGSNQPDHFMYTLPMLTGNPFGGSATTGLQAVDSGQGVWEPGAGPGDAGITWLADADLSRTQALMLSDTFGSDGSMQQPTAVDWVKALTTNRWLGKTGWRIPTPQELATLYTARATASEDPATGYPIRTTSSGASPSETASKGRTSDRTVCT